MKVHTASAKYTECGVQRMCVNTVQSFKMMCLFEHFPDPLQHMTGPCVGLHALYPGVCLHGRRSR